MALRRRFLRSALGAVTALAGCADRQTPTDSETPTEPPPRSCPDIPSELDQSTAGSFAVEFERAYTWNHALAVAGHVSDIDLNLDMPPDVEPAGEGYRVTIDEVFVGIRGSFGFADETYIANYYVADGVLLRAESSSAPADAREEGTEPDCRLG